MQQLFTLFALARPLSLKDYTHRLLFCCMLGALLGAGSLYLLQQQASLSGALSLGFYAAITVFFSWAICRELHPDAPAAAFLSIGLASLAFWHQPTSNPLLLLCILLALRLMNNSTGRMPTPADIGILIALACWLLYTGSVTGGLLTAVAFWCNSRTQQAPAAYKILAVLLFSLSLLSIGVSPSRHVIGYLSTRITIMIIALATGVAFFIRTLKQPNSTSDAGDQPLSLQRLKTAQSVTLLLVSSCSLWYGDAYFYTVAPIWTSCGAIFLYEAARKPLAQKQVSGKDRH